MSTEHETRLELEIAHVLLIDVVGYSKLLVNEQIEVLQLMNQIVRTTPQFRAAESKGKLIRLPTGDGMALLFFDSVETPVECALEISRAATQKHAPGLRMGVHSGPIKEVQDVNDRANYAGAGINMAQRVLDCGDAGHILLSARVADDLSSYRHWHPHLQDLGECEVKHGLKLHLFNLCKDGAGNPIPPEKVRRQQSRWAAGWHARTAVAAPGGRKRIGALLLSTLVVTGLSVGLWAILRTPASPREKSLAVLPFANLNEEKSDASFVDGVQEDILIDLSKVADLKVISRTSVMQYKPGVPRNLREIGRALGVSYLLEGNVQRSGTRVRVHAQLIDARTDMHLWANRYDRELADVFAIQSQIAAEIVAQLQATLSPSEKAAIEDRPTADMAAYDLYVRGKAAIDSANYRANQKEFLLEAVTLLTQATARDPAFFLAFYELANAHDLLFLDFDRSPARLAAATSAIQTLQRLQPGAGETHLALARHLYWGYLEYEHARTELHLAQNALPNNPVPPLLTGYIDRRQGNWDGALRNLLRALELDPRNSFYLKQIALAYFSLRRFPEMGAALDRAISVTPQDLDLRMQRMAVDLEWRADTKPLHDAIESVIQTDPAAAASFAYRWFYLSLCERDVERAGRALDRLGADGCYSEGAPFPRAWCEGLVARIKGDEGSARNLFTRAASEAEKAVIDQPQYAGAICAAAVIQAFLGNKDAAIRGGRQAVELVPMSKDAVDGPLLAGYLAMIYAWTGEEDLAIEQLRLVTSVPSYVSYGYLRLHPLWDALRGDPRFEEIVASLAPK